MQVPGLEQIRKSRWARFSDYFLLDAVMTVFVLSCERDVGLLVIYTDLNVWVLVRLASHMARIQSRN